MPTSKLESYLKNQDVKQFSSQTFTDFRSDLLNYANTYYKDNILDFSEVSLGGMLLDFASIVGDSLVFYAEQQFKELDYSTATDPDNIVKHLRKANIKSSKASPSSVDVTFTLEIKTVSETSDVKTDLLPVIKKGTTLVAESGIIFTLQEDLDFSSAYFSEVGEESLDGNRILSYFVSKKGLCVSGEVLEEVFNIPDNGDYFSSISLERENITNIISVVDNDNNEYYEVDYLSQSTVFKSQKFKGENYINIIPAPRRFVREESFLTGLTSLRFGNGNNKSVKDDIFYSPEDLLLPVKHKETFSKISLDPGRLLKSDTLGVSPNGKSLIVTYKAGGGVSHNVLRETINTVVGTPIIIFSSSTDSDEADFVVSSLTVTNKENAVGGTLPLSLEELKMQIPAAIRSQNRIVSYEDLISRIMTMPTDFGRINKVVALDSLYNSSSKDLFVICKDSNGFYVPATDAIKINISNYLNEYRVIGDSFNIVDAPVFNFGIVAKIKVRAGFDPENVQISIFSRIIEKMRFDLLQIGEPIDVNSIDLVIKSTEGVFDVITPKQNLIVSKVSDDNVFSDEIESFLEYNVNSFNPVNSYSEGLIYPQRGGIFEIKFTFEDIIIETTK